MRADAYTVGRFRGSPRSMRAETDAMPETCSTHSPARSAAPCERSISPRDVRQWRDQSVRREAARYVIGARDREPRLVAVQNNLGRFTDSVQLSHSRTPVQTVPRATSMTEGAPNISVRPNHPRRATARIDNLSGVISPSSPAKPPLGVKTVLYRYYL